MMMMVIMFELDRQKEMRMKETQRAIFYFSSYMFSKEL